MKSVKDFTAIRWTMLAVFLLTTAAVFGQDVLVEKQLSLALAQEAATTAIDKARKDGYRVSVTIVNRAGQVIVQLRDDGAAPHTTDTS
jgi:hypothetical protein